MTMTTKELLALVERWRDEAQQIAEVLDMATHEGIIELGAIMDASTKHADELAPIATALCAEVEALRKVADAARRSLSQTAANQRDGLVPTVYYRAHQDLANALSAIDAARSRNEHEG